MCGTQHLLLKDILLEITGADILLLLKRSNEALLLLLVCTGQCFANDCLSVLTATMEPTCCNIDIALAQVTKVPLVNGLGLASPPDLFVLRAATLGILRLELTLGKRPGRRVVQTARTNRRGHAHWSLRGVIVVLVLLLDWWGDIELELVGIRHQEVGAAGLPDAKGLGSSIPASVSHRLL